MRYEISGRQIDIGAALQSHVESELDRVVEKYAGRPTDASAKFSRDGHMFACEAMVHLSTGLHAQATGKANEIYAAFDAAAEKMDKQLRRYKRRLKDHHKERSTPVDAGGSMTYVLAASEDGGDDAEPETLQPMIIAETPGKVPSLTVGEAVMQMELAGAPVLVFRNEKRSLGVNVVYRREDGNIGWIDPT